MQKREKRVAAALAAVQLYLQEEAAAAQAVLEQSIVPANVSVDQGAWTQAGRMEAMGARRMMQMRVFART